MLPSDDDGVSVSGAECARARAGELGGVEASVSGAGASKAACSFFMVGVASGAGAGAGTGAGTGAVFGVGAAAVGAGAAAFAVNTGENCGGPVFFDGFVFWRGPVLSPAALSFRRRSCRPGEPLLILVDGVAAFLPPDVGRGIIVTKVVPAVAARGYHAPFWCRFQDGELS